MQLVYDTLNFYSGNLNSNKKKAEQGEIKLPTVLAVIVKDFCEELNKVSFGSLETIKNQTTKFNEVISDTVSLLKSKRVYNSVISVIETRPTILALRSKSNRS